MWIYFAFFSAFFAGITTILTKIGVKNVDSYVATAIRTTVVLIFAWIIVFIKGSYVSKIPPRTLIFLILSGIMTGLSWICYFKALQSGDVNKVASVDKSSTVLTVILAFIFLGENLSLTKAVGAVLITGGTYMMVAKKESAQKKIEGSGWLYYALLSALFAALTSILGKIGVTGIDSDYGTAIRTVVVLITAWILVFTTKKKGEIKKINGKTMLFLCLSGITAGLSWFSYYKALQNGEAGTVVSIDKLSIVVTVVFSCTILKEKLSGKGFLGLLGIISGTLIMLNSI